MEEKEPYWKIGIKTRDGTWSYVRGRLNMVEFLTTMFNDINTEKMTIEKCSQTNLKTRKRG